MAKIDTIDFSVFDSYSLSTFFKDEFAPYVGAILNQLFKVIEPKDRAAVVLKPFDNNDTRPFIMNTFYYDWIIPHLKVTQSILDWAGCADVLKGMTEIQMYKLLSCAEKSYPSLLDFIFEQARDVLSSTEPGKDFFYQAQQYFPTDKVGILARANISALKEPLKNGYPRFMCLWDQHNKLLIQLIEEDPDLLNFNTSLGLTLEDLVTNMSEDDADAKKFKSLMILKQKRATAEQILG